MKQKHSEEMRLISKQFFRLLPLQIILAVVPVLNDLISAYFGSNYADVSVLSAIALYCPLVMGFNMIRTTLFGGSQIVCGEYMGQNAPDKTQKVFATDMMISFLIAAFLSVLMGLCAAFDVTAAFAKEEGIRADFNLYLLGQCFGLVPMIMGHQLSGFLALENRMRRTFIASVALVGTTLVSGLVFVLLSALNAFTLALSSAIGMWMYFLIQALGFTGGRSRFKFALKNFDLKESKSILLIGYPGALTFGYQAVRGIVLNNLIMDHVGADGLGSTAVANSVLNVFWCVPFAFIAVARILMSVSIGEEDRLSLVSVMRVVLYRVLPVMGAVCLVFIAFANFTAGLFIEETASRIYELTVWNLRIVPLCMPITIFFCCYVAYSQSLKRQGIVHVISAIDGVIAMVVFSTLFISLMGMFAIYFANIFNGVICCLVIVIYSWIMKKKSPQNMEDLMLIPENFGASEDQRIDINITSMQEVMEVSGQAIEFCRARGVDERRAFIAGLALEEMAKNIVNYGFAKDRRKHSIDIRIVYKDDRLILRIKDDCIPFNPADHHLVFDENDPGRSIGIRMIYNLTSDFSYQNILGLNALTVTV